MKTVTKKKFLLQATHHYLEKTTKQKEIPILIGISISY